MDVQSVEEWSAADVDGKEMGGEMAYAASGGGEWECGGEGKDEGKGKRSLLHSHHRPEMDCSVLPKRPHIPSAQAFPSKTGSSSLSSSHGNTEKGRSEGHLELWRSHFTSSICSTKTNAYTQTSFFSHSPTNQLHPHSCYTQGFQR